MKQLELNGDALGGSADKEKIMDGRRRCHSSWDRMELSEHRVLGLFTTRPSRKYTGPLQRHDAPAALTAFMDLPVLLQNSCKDNIALSYEVYDDVLTYGDLDEYLCHPRGNSWLS